MVFSNDTNCAREDEWLTQLPALSTSTSRQVHTSVPVLGKPRYQKPNPPVYPHPQPGTGDQLPPIRNLVPGLWEPGTSKSSQQTLLADGKSGSPVYPLRPVSLSWSNKATYLIPVPSSRRIIARARVNETSPVKPANPKNDPRPLRLNERTMNGPRLRIASLILMEGPSASFNGHHRLRSRSEKNSVFDLAPVRRLRSRRVNAQIMVLSPHTTKKYFETR